MADGSTLVDALSFDEENRRIFGKFSKLKDTSFLTEEPIIIMVTATDPAG